VTNVTFEGLLTEHQDISGKADKTNTYTKAETDAALGEFARTNKILKAGPYLSSTGGVVNTRGGIMVNYSGPTLGAWPQRSWITPSSIGMNGGFQGNGIEFENRDVYVSHMFKRILMHFPFADSWEDGADVGDLALRSDITDTDLTPASNHTDRALAEFASTGAVARAATYGTPNRWTDATGCVWEVMLNVWVDHAEGNVFRGGTSIFPSEVEGDMRGYLYYDSAAMEYVGGTGGGWYYNGSNSGGTPGAVFAGGPDATSLDNGRFTFGNFTNLVGRVALTNDIPPEQEWPAELVHTNTPLIFADGEDTNVTSIALRAQPENYTSLSFLSPVSYYLPNRFSLLELGHDYQIAAAQWFQVGRYLYAQNPENIVFVGGSQHRSLQDYLDACSPQTMADLLSCYIPTNGGGRIHGDLTIDGRLTAGELITITNSDIHAKGFQVVNKVLTADGLMASNGMVRLNCARFVIGFGTPRIHLETNSPSAITYGGTWDHPQGSVFSWQDEHIQQYLAGNVNQQDIELRNPYVRYMDVKDEFMAWKIKDHAVNNGPLKHFTLANYRTHHFTDADVGTYGIEFTINSNAHVRIIYDFATTPPSAVYFDCGRDGNDTSATMLSSGTELLSPTAGVKTLLEIDHLSGWTFIVKETPLTYQNTVMPWIDAQEESEP
jgi:hypothetical protein